MPAETLLQEVVAIEGVEDSAVWVDIQIDKNNEFGYITIVANLVSVSDRGEQATVICKGTSASPLLWIAHVVVQAVKSYLWCVGGNVSWSVLAKARAFTRESEQAYPDYDWRQRIEDVYSRFTSNPEIRHELKGSCQSALKTCVAGLIK